jgi:hypothetical protein
LLVGFWVVFGLGGVFCVFGVWGLMVGGKFDLGFVLSGLGCGVGLVLPKMCLSFIGYF